MQEDQAKIELFEHKPLPGAIATMAVPMVLSSLVMVLYSLADTYFVSLLNSSIQNAAVTLASPVLLAFNAVNNLFGVGASSMMSRAMGLRDYETVRRTSVFSFYCALASGLLFSLLCTVFHTPLLGLLGADLETAAATSEYMLWTVTFGAAPAILNVVMGQMVRAEGASVHASIGVMSGCLLNIVLDPIFILPWGLNMGAAGAGLATLISNCVACLYFLVLMFVKRGRTYVSIDPRKFSFNKRIVAGVFGVGLPASIQNLLNVTSMTIFNNFAAAFGTDALAAMGIVKKIDQIPMNIAMGLTQGIMPLVSYNYSSGNIKRAKGAVLLTGKIGTVFLLSVTALFYFGAGGVMSLFTKIDMVAAFGVSFLRGMCLGLTFLCLDFLAVGVFQAVGLGKYALLFAFTRKILLEIPLIYLLNALDPLYGLPYAQTITEILMAALSITVLIRLFRKWEQSSLQTAPAE